MAAWRSTSLTELKLPGFFFPRRRSLPMAERRVDFLRCGGAFWPSAGLVLELPVLCEVALTDE